MTQAEYDRLNELLGAPDGSALDLTPSESAEVKTLLAKHRAEVGGA